MSIKGEILEHIVVGDIVLALVETVAHNIIYYVVVELALEHEPIVLRTCMSLYKAKQLLNEELYYRTVNTSRITTSDSNTRTINYRSI